MAMDLLISKRWILICQKIVICEWTSRSKTWAKSSTNHRKLVSCLPSFGTIWDFNLILSPFQYNNYAYMNGGPLCICLDVTTQSTGVLSQQLRKLSCSLSEVLKINPNEHTLDTHHLLIYMLKPHPSSWYGLKWSLASLYSCWAVQKGAQQRVSPCCMLHVAL